MISVYRGGLNLLQLSSFWATCYGTTDRLVANFDLFFYQGHLGTQGLGHINEHYVVIYSNHVVKYYFRQGYFGVGVVHIIWAILANFIKS